ncbi:MAG: hypothetical protein ACO4B5_09890 [Steroidobacteraceae bacterium]
MARSNQTPPRGERRGDLARQSAEARIRFSYGSSDNTAPSFNNTQYVRYGSVNRPFELGLVDQLTAEIEGLVGSESGTNSLFFRFTITRPARIEAWRIPLNPYTDQYVSISLNRTDGATVATGLFSPVTSPSGGDPDDQVVMITPIEVGYVEEGYWQPEYTEVVETRVPEIVDPGEALIGARVPEGSYYFVVTSSQWHALPYHFALGITPSKPLRGAAELALQPVARIGRVNLAGLATLGSESTARLRTFHELDGAAQVAAEPRAFLRRVSPFG